MIFKAKKDIWWWKLIAFFIPEQMTSMWTTIGETIYYPKYVSNSLKTLDRFPLMSLRRLSINRVFHLQ